MSATNPPDEAKDYQAWRKQKRSELLALRRSLTSDIFERSSTLVLEQLANILASRSTETLGFYWPFRGEISLLNLIAQHIAKGGTAALPVVLEKARPLEFRQWQPGDEMTLGVLDIPYPTKQTIVQPDTLIVPVVAFDKQCFRLGYGGGYYDRTLASYPRKPLTIGIGFESARLETTFPHQSDIPMDCIVTEAGIHWPSSSPNIE
jgi:5-formyltetrahydrofolate cyclo-ligase